MPIHIIALFIMVHLDAGWGWYVALGVSFALSIYGTGELIRLLEKIANK